MPDPTGVKITVPPVLADSGQTIIGIATQIGTELDQLKTLLLPLHDFWMGAAQGDWQVLQLKWDYAAFNLMSGAGTLGAIGNAATTNWNNYSETEAANIRTWAH